MIRFLFCTRSPSPNPATNSKEISLPRTRLLALSDQPVIDCCNKTAWACTCVKSSPRFTTHPKKQDILKFKNCFILSFHSVSYIAKRSLITCQGTAPSQVNAGPQASPLHFLADLSPCTMTAAAGPDLLSLCMGLWGTRFGLRGLHKGIWHGRSPTGTTGATSRPARTAWRPRSDHSRRRPPRVTSGLTSSGHENKKETSLRWW